MRKVIVTLILLVMTVVLATPPTAFGHTCTVTVDISTAGTCGCVNDKCSGHFTRQYVWGCGGTCPSGKDCLPDGTKSMRSVYHQWPCVGECDELGPEPYKGCDLGTGVLIYGLTDNCACI